MPTYQYKREDGTMFEIVQKISESALETCPDTGQKVKRVITGGSGVVYKGSGWYVTDYKNRSGNGTGAANSGANGTGAASAGSSANTSGGADNTKGSAGSKSDGNGAAAEAAGSAAATAPKDSGA